jgi:hypothetical protein
MHKSRVYSFGKEKISAPSKKQEISEISGIIGQNQIDLIFFKTKNDIIYIKNTNFENIYFSDPTKILEIPSKIVNP